MTIKSPKQTLCVNRYGISILLSFARKCENNNSCDMYDAVINTAAFYFQRCQMISGHYIRV